MKFLDSICILTVVSAFNNVCEAFSGKSVNEIRISKERDVSRRAEGKYFESLTAEKKDIIGLAIETVFQNCSFPSPMSVEDLRPGTAVYATGEVQRPLVYNDVDTAFNDIVHVAESGDFNRVIFIAHGWHEDASYYWLHDLKDAIIRYHPDQIVVLVEWEIGLLTFIRDNVEAYRQSASNMPVVGQYIASIVKRLKRDNRTKAMNIYGLGHSLGAHVMGHAGRESDGAFDRVTGLDPAGPCFEVHNTDLRLRNTDATFVDVIHTDGHTDSSDAFPMYMGTLTPLGDQDFYPNFGRRPQPGCFNTRDLLKETRNFYECSHMRAAYLYQWSISNRGKFQTRKEILSTITYESINTTVPSDNIGFPVEMGYFADSADTTRTGNFYIETKGAEPYA